MISKRHKGLKIKTQMLSILFLPKGEHSCMNEEAEMRKAFG
jgi:hypothetical protein